MLGVFGDLASRLISGAATAFIEGGSLGGFGVSQRRIDPASARASLCDPFRVPADAPTPAQVDAVCGRAAVNWIEGERRARLIVSRDLEVMWMNGAARALSDDGEAFGLEGRRLAPSSPILASLVASAGADEARCTVMPGDGGRRWVAWARQVCAAPTALIGLTLQRARGEARFQALIDHHFLTPSEGRIIEMLLGGAETGRIAQALDISIETLRTHLKHAYQKMGVRSRGELFAEAISFVGP